MEAVTMDNLSKSPPQAEAGAFLPITDVVGPGNTVLF